MAVKQFEPQDILSASTLAGGAYKVQDSRGLTKLDAMESPFSWSTGAMSQLADAVSVLELNRYPDPDPAAVKKAICSYYQLSQEQPVLLGNGSDELIQILIMAIAASGKPVLSVDPSFVMYKLISQWMGVRYSGVELNEDFSFPLQSVLERVEEEQPALVFLACPNNPTGNLFPLDELCQVIEAAHGLVVIDEAYTAFASRDHLALLDKYDNVLVMRTLSKIGLAGLRLGMLFGHPKWISQFDKLRLPYNINQLTQQAAVVALSNPEELVRNSVELIAQRNRLSSFLKEQACFQVYPSEANFILVRCTKDVKAQAIYDALIADHKILIKKLDGAHPMLENCLRFTVGSQDENDKVMAALSSMLG